MSAAPETSYDAVPYQSQAFYESHPSVMAMLARMHGLRPPSLATAKVLELGCASGGNLIPMALGLPGAGSWASTCRTVRLPTAGR